MTLMKPLIISLTLISNSAFALNLMQSYEAALENDPTFRAAIKEYEAGEYNVTIGRSALLPKVNASYGANRAYSTQWGQQYTGGPNYSNTYQYPSTNGGVYLQQAIFSLEALAKYKQGDAQTEQSRAKYTYDTQELLIRVAQAYTDVLAAKDLITFTTKERDAYQEQYNLTKKLKERGEKDVSDLAQAEADYHLADAKIVEYEVDLENKKRKLKDLTKLTDSQISKISPLSKNFQIYQLPVKNWGEWEQDALSTNYYLKSLTNKTEVARQEYKKNDAGHYPTVNLVGGVTTQQSNTPTSIGQTTNQNYIGVNLSIPIFNGGEVYGKGNQSYSLYEKAKAEEEAAKDQILTEMKKQYDTIRATAKKIDALNKAVNAGSIAVKSANAGIKYGEKLNVDAIIAEKTLYNAQKDLAAAKYTYIMSYLKIGQLAGNLEINNFMKVAKDFN